MNWIRRHPCLLPFPLLLLLLLLLPLCSCAGAGPTARGHCQHPPNIVFFLVDDMGWRDPVCYGHGLHETPQIDRLAREGMLFTQAYANGPNCAPSRACLMSGQYTPRHGIYTVGRSARGKVRYRKLIPTKNRTSLADEVFTLAEALQANGYATALFGKWHLGNDPKSQGFDENIGGDQRGSPHRGYFSPYGNPNLSDGREGEYLTDRLTSEATAFIQRHRDRPFFLYMSHYSVHTPIQGKPELVAKYVAKLEQSKSREAKSLEPKNHPGYAAMVESTDQSLGRILETLEVLQLAENTVVFFFSDNGGHGRFTSMKPLRGAKGMLYEGGIREPLIVRWPGRIKAGSRCETPVIGLDFYPTILEMTKTSGPEHQILDGLSLLPLLAQSHTLKPRPLYWHFPAYLQGGRGGVPGTERWRTTPAGAMRLGKYKLIEFFEDGRLELYDLEQDPGEENNLAQTRPAKTQEMHDLLATWRRQVKAPVPQEPNPRYKPDD